MIGELNVICVCTYLALFSGTTFIGHDKAPQTRSLELTVGTLRIAISVRPSEKRLDILTKDRFVVKANHLVFQVKNPTAVRYTKRNGGDKTEGQSS
jgi:hypothetical protein